MASTVRKEGECWKIMKPFAKNDAKMAADASKEAIVGALQTIMVKPANINIVVNRHAKMEVPAWVQICAAAQLVLVGPSVKSQKQTLIEPGAAINKRNGNARRGPTRNGSGESGSEPRNETRRSVETGSGRNAGRRRRRTAVNQFRSEKEGNSFPTDTGAQF